MNLNRNLNPAQFSYPEHGSTRMAGYRSIKNVRQTETRTITHPTQGRAGNKWVRK